MILKIHTNTCRSLLSILMFRCVLGSSVFEALLENNQMYVNWNHAENAWNVKFQNAHLADLVIAQVCARHPCQNIGADGMYACHELRYLISSSAWSHANLKFSDDDCLSLLSPMPATSSMWASAQKQYSSSFGITVQWPLSLSITYTPAILQPFLLNHTFNSSTWQLPVRLILMKRFMDIPLVAIHMEHLVIPLQISQTIRHADMQFEHECVRRGLSAAPLSTMDLFQNARGDLVCVWDCRFDHIRVPFNSAPMPKSTNITPASPQQMCLPFPATFAAVEFDFLIEISGVTTPSLLSNVFLQSLDSAGDNMAMEMTNALKLSVNVYLSIPETTYHNINFRSLVYRCVAFRQETHNFQTAPNSDYVPHVESQTYKDPFPFYSAPRNFSLSRRLLFDTLQTPFVVSGIAIIPATTLPSAKIDESLRRALTSTPHQSFGTLVTETYDLQISNIHVLSLPLDRDESIKSPVESINLSIVIFLVCAIVVPSLFFVYLQYSKSKKNNSRESQVVPEVNWLVAT